MEKEVCRNPLKPNCRRIDIQLYIQIGSVRLPICSGCWGDIANGDAEWDEDGFEVNGRKIGPRGLDTVKIQKDEAGLSS